MIEWLIPVGLGAVALIPQREYNDRKKIEEVFRNVKFFIRDGNTVKRPKFLGKGKGENYTRYDYRLPLGVSHNDKVIDCLSSALRKTVEIKGENIISIYVYDSKVPDLVLYRSLSRSETEPWRIILGRSHTGDVSHNFDHTPHMTVAGTTRFGKTVLLKSVMTQLIENHTEDVRIHLIDLKGGLEFERYRHLKQVASVSSSQAEAHAVLLDILKDMNETMADFKFRGISNVVKSDVKRRTFVIVDEGAELAPDKHMSPERKKQLGFCQHALSEIARIGGAIGLRLIFCTQYPTADTLPRQVKQNSDAKISFRLPTGYASEVAIDEPGAEVLERKGQAVYKTHDRVTIQTPLIEDDEMWERLGKYEEVNDEQEAETSTQGGGDTIQIG